MSETNTEVAVRDEQNALATLAQMMAEDAGKGSSNITSDAMAIPFLKLIQATSPEFKNDPDNFKPGMLLHTISGRTFDVREKGGKPLKFVLAHFVKQIVEWGDKDAGNGGIKARHACTPNALALYEKLPKNVKTGKRLAPNAINYIFPLPDRQDGNILEETAYHYLVLDADGELMPAVFPLKSTGLTPSKKLMSKVDGFKRTEPTWMRVYEVVSWLDKQKSGAQETFMNVRFDLVGKLEDTDLYLAARSFFDSVSRGQAVIDDSAEAGQSGAPADSGSGSGNDDEAPF